MNICDDCGQSVFYIAQVRRHNYIITLIETPTTGKAANKQKLHRLHLERNSPHVSKFAHAQQRKLPIAEHINGL